MLSILRYVGILLLSLALIAGPAYLLLQDSLSDPDNLVPGIAVVLLAPAIGWVVPLAVMLVVLWWRDIKIGFGSGALLGASAVVIYVIAVSIYLLVLGRFRGVEYIFLRLAYSLPSVVIVACFTGLASWAMFKIFPARSKIQ